LFTTLGFTGVGDSHAAPLNNKIHRGDVVIPLDESLVEVPGDSVYASPSEQDAIYEIIENSEAFVEFLNNYFRGIGVCIVKESITPYYYYVDFLEYAKTGVFDVKPVVIVDGRMDRDSDKDEPNCFVAKAVTTDDGVFAGDITFYVENGVAEHWSSGLSQQILRRANPSDFYILSGNPSASRTYYAEHAERIQALTNKDFLMSAAEVRYVSISNIGVVF